MRYLLVCILLLVPYLSWGRDNDIAFFRYYYDELDLPQTTILKIDQDSKGYIWLATSRGVYRFDGNEAVALSEICPEAHSLFDIYTSWIMIDKNDKLWMGNGYIYDLNEGKLYKNSVIEGNLVDAPVLEDSGCVWFNCYDKFVRYDSKTNEVCSVNAAVGTGFTKSEHYVWGVENARELVRMYWADNNISFVKYSLPQGIANDISVLYAVSDYELLIGTKSKGLWIYDVRLMNSRQIFQESYIRDILCFSPSVYWVATENGIYMYNMDKNEIRHWGKDPHDIYAIQDHAIYTFFKDAEGGVWCGSYFRGLSYVPNALCNFKNYRPSKRYSGLEGTVVRELCKDNDGNLWIGTEDHGVNCFDVSAECFENYSKSHGLNTNNIHGLCIDNDLLWCGSFDSGIDLFDVKKKKIVHSFRAGDGKSNLKSNFVFTILKTRANDIWIGTDTGVQIYNRENNSFSDPIKGIRICSQLYQDHKNNIWVVCSNELICVSEEQEIVGRYSLDSGLIQSVMETRNHEIWVATSLGISRLDLSKKIFVNHILSEQNASTNYAFRILEDEQGYLWVSTGYGLVRYQPQTGTSYVFTTLEGLSENRFNVSSSLESDGFFYFGTINGFIAFDSNTFASNRAIPKPKLSKIICKGVNTERTIYEGSDGIGPVNYTENSLTFEFSPLTYTAPEALRYRYCLEPVDKGWHVQQGSYSFTYPSLSPGKYILRFQSTDYNGEWTNNETVYKIEIKPPFYFSWWAKLLYCVLAFVVLFYVLYKWQEQIRKRQKSHIQEVKDATEKELYHTKINFFTTIVHEIRTPLTLIKAPLEKELEKNQSENLLLVEKNVERLQSLCTQLLDFRRIESEHLQLNFVKTNISDLLKGILYRFSAQIIQNNLKCEDNLETMIFEAPVDREALTKIVSNMLANAVKYASQVIKIELGIAGNNFYLIISNDGVLIDRNDRNKIFNMFYRTEQAEKKVGSGIGLAFCRSLAEMHNGSLELIDRNDYTSFKLTLPLKQQVVFSIESVIDDTDVAELPVPDSPEVSGETILVVEDEPELRNFLKDSLSDLYNVRVASNGLKAMEIIEKTPVSIVITDVMMPKMDGCELCRTIKNRVELCGIPIVMLTAKNTVEAKLEGYMAGAEEYIEKPFSMKYLLARIAAIIEKRKKAAEKNFVSQAIPQMCSLENNVDSALVEKFRKLVDENLMSDKLNIPFLCEQLGMSQTTFFRKMKNVLDVSPNDYIRIARIERAAKVLLESDDVRISDVAYEFGFSSPSYFTRCFIQHYGMSPKDYILRKKCESKEV